MAPRPPARRPLTCDLARVALLALLLAAASPAIARAAPDCLTLNVFAGSRPGVFPAGWEVRTGEGRRVYTLAEEAGRPFLRAVSQGLGIQAAREIRGWSLDTHPVLAWSWRPREFPRGADERRVATNDSALAVYVGVPYSKIRGPRAVKYVWSEKVPAGTRLASNAGLTQVRVLRTGPPASRDAWVEERVNVREDWKIAFEDSTTPAPAGIAVLTDADDTRSTAAGDYADFRLCRG